MWFNLVLLFHPFQKMKMYILCQIFKLRKQGRKEKAWRARRKKEDKKITTFF